MSRALRWIDEKFAIMSANSSNILSGAGGRAGGRPAMVASVRASEAFLLAVSEQKKKKEKDWEFKLSVMFLVHQGHCALLTDIWP